MLIWCGSIEVFRKPAATHQPLEDFEQGLQNTDPDISLSQIYAYVALKLDVPFANSAPPPYDRCARSGGAGTKQTHCGLRQRHQDGANVHEKPDRAGFESAACSACPLGFRPTYWGTDDGKVLDDPKSFKSKEETKLFVLDWILQPDLYPVLYKDLYHAVRINYSPPRGDSKEGWDNIDIFGWLGYPMQLKIDFLRRDAMLAAPLTLDLVLFLDLAQRTGMHGIQEWRSFYFKSPMHGPGVYPEHDIFIQLMKLKKRLFAGSTGRISSPIWVWNTTTELACTPSDADLQNQEQRMNVPLQPRREAGGGQLCL